MGIASVFASGLLSASVSIPELYTRVDVREGGGEEEKEGEGGTISRLEEEGAARREMRGSSTSSFSSSCSMPEVHSDGRGKRAFLRKPARTGMLEAIFRFIRA